MVQVFFILVLVVLIGFLLFFIVKNFAAPRKIEGIQKLIKQGKYSSVSKRPTHAKIARVPPQILRPSHAKIARLPRRICKTPRKICRGMTVFFHLYL